MPPSWTLNLADWFEQHAAKDPAFAAKLADFEARREAFLASMSPEDRAAYLAREEAEADAEDAEQKQRDREIRERERAIRKRSREIEAMRKAGTIGVLGEVGKPHGLSAIAVGKILDRHGLRERVEFDDGHGALQILRGVRDGFAVHDHYNGREYWIAEKLAPLLDPKRKP